MNWTVEDDRNCRGQIGCGFYILWSSKDFEFLKHKHFNYSTLINAQHLNWLLNHMRNVICCFACQHYWDGISVTFSYLLISCGLYTMKVLPVPMRYNYYEYFVHVIYGIVAIQSFQITVNILPYSVKLRQWKSLTNLTSACWIVKIFPTKILHLENFGIAYFMVSYNLLTWVCQGLSRYVGPWNLEILSSDYP